MQLATAGTVRTILIAYNESGRRIGETHHNSRIPDAKVEEIRDRHEYEGWNYLKISNHYSMSVNTIKKICTYERRGQRPERWKKVTIVPIGPEYLPEASKAELNRVTDCPLAYGDMVIHQGIGTPIGGRRPVSA